MVFRAIAHPLVALPIITESADVFKHPELHVSEIKRLTEKLPTQLRTQIEQLSDAKLKTAVRVQAGAIITFATALALGKCPRKSGAALAILSLPQVLASIVKPRSVGGAKAIVKAEKKARREKLFKSLSQFGLGILIASDTGGKPSNLWKLQNALNNKSAAKKNHSELA